MFLGHLSGGEEQKHPWLFPGRAERESQVISNSIPGAFSPDDCPQGLSLSPPCPRALTRPRFSLASLLPQVTRSQRGSVWVGPFGDGDSPPPPWSVPIIDGINSKAWQLLGDSLGKQELLVLADHGGGGGAQKPCGDQSGGEKNEKRKEKSRSPHPRLPALLPCYSMVSQSICPDVCAALGSQSCWQKGPAPEGAEISPTSYTYPEPTSGRPCT